VDGVAAIRIYRERGRRGNGNTMSRSVTMTENCSREDTKNCERIDTQWINEFVGKY